MLASSGKVTATLVHKHFSMLVRCMWLQVLGPSHALEEFYTNAAVKQVRLLHSFATEPVEPDRSHKLPFVLNLCLVETCWTS